MNDLDYDNVDVLDSDSSSDHSSEEESNGTNEYGDWKVVVGVEEMNKETAEQNKVSKAEQAAQTRKKFMLEMAN